jgi:hypothetical protein
MRRKEKWKVLRKCWKYTIDWSPNLRYSTLIFAVVEDAIGPLCGTQKI